MAALQDIAAPGATEAARSKDDDANWGLLAAILTYGSWGFLPLLFHFVESVDPMTVVAHRSVWSLLLVTVILAAGKRLGEVRAAFKDARVVRSILTSSMLLAGNWLLFVWAVTSGHVLEASFGYFITPLVNVAIGMVLLGERQNRWQLISILIAVVAIGIQAVGVGGLPVVAVGLALSFGFYGYFRKTAQLGSTPGLMVETLMILPLALGYLAYSFATGGPGPHADPSLMIWLMLTGPATALPLLLFAYAVQRLRMTTIGMFQYIAPSLQFLLAITFFGEELSPVRLVSFVLIWLSLAVFTFDTVRRRGKAAAL